eukprot:TRINITY_DN8819_c0_g1_i2.p1 TRINITY_DN8819_c0_g1~~TRINITY_DN8819_c0_g1_i2.p1  ORF type:complete len:110 (-),score=43.34 TRINITY_DN8819_c0_g1_i2:281-610(-)
MSAVTGEEIITDFEVLGAEAREGKLTVASFSSAFTTLAQLIGGFGPGMGFVKNDIDTKITTINQQCAPKEGKEQIEYLVAMMDWEKENFKPMEYAQNGFDLTFEVYWSS